jgi:hypothetical protein
LAPGEANSRHRARPQLTAAVQLVCRRKTSIHIVPTGDDAPAASASTSGSSSPFTISEPITLSTASSTIDLAFSPSGRYFFTWERLAQAEEGKSTPKNLRVFWLGSGKAQIVEIAGFTQKAYDQW